MECSYTFLLFKWNVSCRELLCFEASLELIVAFSENYIVVYLTLYLSLLRPQLNTLILCFFYCVREKCEVCMFNFIPYLIVSFHLMSTHTVGNGVTQDIFVFMIVCLFSIIILLSATM